MAEPGFGGALVIRRRSAASAGLHRSEYWCAVSKLKGHPALAESPESRFKDSRSSRDSDMLSGISKIEVWP
jgi:hypothetical protein